MLYADSNVLERVSTVLNRIQGTLCIKTHELAALSLRHLALIRTLFLGFRTGVKYI